MQATDGRKSVSYLRWWSDDPSKELFPFGDS